MELGDPEAAEPGLERAGHVVDARVHDAAVVAGLVGADDRLLVEDRQAQVRTPLAQAERGGEPDDPGADDGDLHALPSAPARAATVSGTRR